MINIKFFLLICALAVAGCSGAQVETSDDTTETGSTCENQTLNITTQPADGSTDVARNTQIVIDVPSGIVPESFDLTNFKISSASGPINGDIDLAQGASPSLTFVPTALLPAKTSVFVSALHDACNTGSPAIVSFSFSTGNDPDGIAPKVVASIPTDNSSGVAVNGQIALYFDEALASQSIDADNFILENDNTAVSGDISYDQSNNYVVFKPQALLDPNSAYVLSVSGVADIAGNAMEGSYELRFITGDALDTTPPSTPNLTLLGFTRATLRWTAPGDDGSLGTAASYKMRYSNQPILTEAAFDLATPVADLPAPKQAGTIQTTHVPGMSPGDRYFFSLKAIDEAGNESGFSSYEAIIPTKTVFAIEAIADENIDDYMGMAVAGGCDINGDGMSDVVVGAPYDDVAGNNTGKVLVYFGDDDGSIGSNSGDISGGRIADLVIDGIDSHSSSTDDYFGWSVACNGDYNGDGFDDILVGAPYEDTSNGSTYRPNSGAAYLFYGKNFTGPFPMTMSAQAFDVIFQGTSNSDYFGWSVNFLGDINGDGHDEAGAAAMQAEFSDSDEGTAHIFFGSQPVTGITILDAASDIKVEGDLTGSSSYGINLIARSGDVDGDGLLDLAFASTRYPTDDLGTVYVYLGKNGYPNYIDIEEDADVIITGEATDDFLGGYATYATALSIDGDINGDGIDDIVVGVPYEDSSLINVGAVYAFFGRSDWSAMSTPTPSTDADMSILGVVTSDYFGISLDTRSDFNNDGIDDLLVGSYGFDNGVGGSRGGAFIFYGNMSPQATLLSTDADVIISHEGGLLEQIGLSDITVSTSDYWGLSVSSAGDINTDGYDDVVIGSPYNLSAGRPDDAGAAYIIY